MKKPKNVPKPPANVHDALLDELRFVRDSGKRAAVFLSGGVDSHSVLFALIELGVPVTAYSFTLDTHESRDFKIAKKTCETMHVPFVPVILSTDVAKLKKYVIYVVKKLGAYKKVDIECLWPMLSTLKQVEEEFVITATSADSHFALSKKACMHYKDKVDYYRTIVFKKANTGQRLHMKSECAKLGKTYFTPYDTTRMCSELYGYTWDELNKPKQKNPIRIAFPDQFERCKVTQHTNLQLGDSGIAKHFEKLLETDLNTRNYKSVIGVYNELARKYLKVTETEENDDD